MVYIRGDTISKGMMVWYGMWYGGPGVCGISGHGYGMYTRVWGGYDTHRTVWGMVWYEGMGSDELELVEHRVSLGYPVYIRVYRVYTV